MTPGSMARFLKAHFAEAWIPGAPSHSGRRTLITRLAERGIDLKAIAEIAGHRRSAQRRCTSRPIRKGSPAYWAEPGHLADSFKDSEILKWLPISLRELIMTEQPDILTQFSTAMAGRAAAANTAIAAIRLPADRYLTGTFWRSDIVIASEQSLPKRDEFELVVAGGSVIKARAAGRDSGTNIAVLKFAQAISSGSINPSDPQVGALALAIGANGKGEASARMGVVNAVGPEWYSSHGGRIDRRILLDINLNRSEEGGPIFEASGGFLGMFQRSGRAGRCSSFPRRRSSASSRRCSRTGASPAAGLAQLCDQSLCRKHLAMRPVNLPA